MSLQKDKCLARAQQARIESVSSNLGWIYLPVADSAVVEVEECIESLSHDDGSLSLSQVLSLGDEEEEFSPLAKSVQQRQNKI